MALSHLTLADILDDAVVSEGATDEVSHCLDSQRAMVSQLPGDFGVTGHTGTGRSTTPGLRVRVVMPRCSDLAEFAAAMRIDV